MDFTANLELPKSQDIYVLRDALDVYWRLGIGQIDIIGEMHQFQTMTLEKELGELSIAHIQIGLEALLRRVKLLLGYHSGGHYSVGSAAVGIAAKRAYELSKMLQKPLAYAQNDRPAFLTTNYDGRLVHYTPDLDAKVQCTAQFENIYTHVTVYEQPQWFVLQDALRVYRRLANGDFSVIAMLVKQGRIPLGSEVVASREELMPDIIGALKQLQEYVSDIPYGEGSAQATPLQDTVAGILARMD